MSKDTDFTWRYTENPYGKNACSCWDCNAEYGDSEWIELVVNPAVWRVISPHFDDDNEGTTGGLLCATCMLKRIAIVFPYNTSCGITIQVATGTCIKGRKECVAHRLIKNLTPENPTVPIETMRGDQ